MKRIYFVAVRIGERLYKSAYFSQLTSVLDYLEQFYDMFDVREVEIKKVDESFNFIQHF